MLIFSMISIVPILRLTLKGISARWNCEQEIYGIRAIINLSVQVSHRHRNSWKAHILPQKVYKSANWNESSVEWTLVDLDFAFVMISNFEVVPQPRKWLILNYITRGYFWFIPENSRFHYGRHFVYQNKTYVLIFYWFIDSGVHLLLISFLWLWDNLQNP